MTATATQAPGFYVGCEDYTAGPFDTVAEAEAERGRIETPRLCHAEHVLTFVAPPGVSIRRVKRYTNHTGRAFVQYERPSTGQVVDLLVRGPYERDSHGYRHIPAELVTGRQARQQAMLVLA